MVREEDAWYKSMIDTLVRQYTAYDLGKNTSSMRPLAEKYRHYCWGDDFRANGREYFRQYNENVRRIAPEGRLLKFNVNQGWRPLCEFLGQPVPGMPFPRSDDWLEYKKEHHGV